MQIAMNLDTGTVTFLILVAKFVLALSFGVSFFLFRRRVALFLSLAFLISGIGYFLYALDPFNETMFGTFLSNSFTQVGFILIVYGILRLIENETNDRYFNYLILFNLIMFAVLAYYPNGMFRVLLLVSTQSVLSIHLIVRLYVGYRVDRSAGIVGIIAIFLLYVFLILSRLIAMLLFGGTEESSLQLMIYSFVLVFILVFDVLVGFFSLMHLTSIHTRELLESNVELLNKATTDALTGLSNKTVLEKELIKEIKRVTRTHKPMSVVMIDINGFKEYNDTRGHLYGDEILKSFAKLLDNRLRVTDVIARYGGDEFILLLPNTDADTASKLLESIQENSSNVRIGNQTTMIEFSAGIFEVNRQISTTRCIQYADRAMYQAKNSEQTSFIIKE